MNPQQEKYKIFTYPRQLMRLNTTKDKGDLKASKREK